VAVLNLDVNHVSDFVQRREDPDVRTTLKLLERGDVSIGLSFFHIIQLGDPRWPWWPELRSILATLPIALFQDRETLFHQELNAAIGRVTGSSYELPRMLVGDIGEWGYTAEYPGEGPLGLIDMYANGEVTNTEILELTADLAATSQRLKATAYGVQQPLGPVRRHVQYHLDLHRYENPPYAQGLSAAALVDRMGGVAALPAYQITHELAMYGLVQSAVKVKPGDIADADIACYSPYASVSALDGPTVQHLRDAKVPCAPRITAKLNRVPELLRRVAAGELVSEPSIA
jgi:hypothetical protein